MFTLSLIFVALSTFPSLCSGRALGAVGKRQDNLKSLQDICDRRYGTTSVVGDKLFLNGGQDVTDRVKSTNKYSNFDGIQYIDLSTTWNIDVPLLSTLSKPTSLITVNEGCAWSDGVNFYQYGGWQTTDDAQESFRVWQYETSPNVWTSISAASDIQRLASGGYTNAPKVKKSYAFGGFMDRATTDDPWYATQGKLQGANGRADLIEFDWETKTVKNITYTNNTKRKLAMTDNSLAYVPVGDSGILISFGGRPDLTISGYSDMANPTEIKYYDIATSAWYYQAAEGAVEPDKVPIPRVEPCTVVQPAPDGSSYNIYMFGGSYEDLESAAYNDMWILSLPSFKWFKVDYPAENTWEIAGNRTSHTCQIIGNRQMAIIGGARSPEAHDQCIDTTIFVFDMSSLSWRSVFNPSEAAYVVPSLITDVIGGDGNGNANSTLNCPIFWNDARTAEIFALGDSDSESTFTGSSIAGSSTPTSTNDESTSATNSSSPTTTSAPVGAIAGGAVGGILALAAIVAIVMVCRKRRRRQERQERQEPQENYGAQAPFMSMREPQYKRVFHELPAKPCRQELPGEEYELPGEEGAGTTNRETNMFEDQGKISYEPASCPDQALKDRHALDEKPVINRAEKEPTPSPSSLQSLGLLVPPKRKPLKSPKSVGVLSEDSK